MNKLMSMVCLKYIYNEKKDFIEALSEFVLDLLIRQQNQTINISQLQDDFRDEFGFEIPYIPMQDILHRLLRRDFLFPIEKGYQVFSDIEPPSFMKIKRSKDIEEKLEKLVVDFMSYVKNNYGRVYSYDEALKILLLFFDENLANLLKNEDFQFVGESIDDELRIVSLFINEVEEEGKYLSDTLIEIAIGNLIISTLVYRDFIPANKQHYSFHCYIDSPILFEISGVNGEIRQTAYINFLNLLTESGIKLMVFKHNYDEFIDTLYRSMDWVNNSNYDPSKASRATRYFIDNKFSEVDIQDFINRSERRISDLGISLRQTPSPNENQQFQIDIEDLEKLITEKYEQGGWYFFEHEKSMTIQRDIKSFEAIYKLRKHNEPRTLPEVKYIMVTTNSTLAFVAREFNNQIGKMNKIPVLINDIALGSIVWVTSIPKTIEEFARAKMIGKAMSIIEPSDKLLSAFRYKVLYEEQRGTIEEDETFVLLQTRQSRVLLTKYTLGDVKRVDNRTPFEILRGLKLPEIVRINNLITTIRNSAKTNSTIYTSLITILLFTILLLTKLMRDGVISIPSELINWISYGINIGLEILSYLLGFSLIPLFFNIRENKYKNICKKKNINYEETRLYTRYLLVWNKMKNKFFSEKNKNRKAIDTEN